MSGVFGGAVAYHAGGWGECGGRSDDDEEAFVLRKGSGGYGEIW